MTLRAVRSLDPLPAVDQEEREFAMRGSGTSIEGTKRSAYEMDTLRSLCAYSSRGTKRGRGNEKWNPSQEEGTSSTRHHLTLSRMLFEKLHECEVFGKPTDGATVTVQFRQNHSSILGPKLLLAMDCVKMSEKNCIHLPSVGKQTAN